MLMLSLPRRIIRMLIFFSFEDFVAGASYLLNKISFSAHSPHLQLFHIFFFVLLVFFLLLFYILKRYFSLALQDFLALLVHYCEHMTQLPIYLILAFTVGKVDSTSFLLWLYILKQVYPFLLRLYNHLPLSCDVWCLFGHSNYFFFNLSFFLSLTN